MSSASGSLSETDLPVRTAHSERVLATLLLPAAEIVRKHGILGASVEQLVDAVGVSKGTLYYHIRTKEGLLYAIHDSVTENGYERWERVIEETPNASASETFARMIEEHCEVIREYRDCVAVMTEETKYLPPDMQKSIRVRRTAYQELLESVLQRGVDRGEFTIASVHQTASLMIGTMNSMYRWFSPEGPRSAHEVAEIATGLFLRGLRG